MKVKILDVREWPSADPGRIGLLDYVITYQTDPFKVGTITMPKEDFTESKMLEKIKEDMAAKAMLMEKEYEI